VKYSGDEGRVEECTLAYEAEDIVSIAGLCAKRAKFLLEILVTTFIQMGQVFIKHRKIAKEMERNLFRLRPRRRMT
jgi:hypothetical protein